MCKIHRYQTTTNTTPRYPFVLSWEYSTCVATLSSDGDNHFLHCCSIVWSSSLRSLSRSCCCCRAQYHCSLLGQSWGSSSPLSFRTLYRAATFCSWRILTPLSRSHNCQFTGSADFCGKIYQGFFRYPLLSFSFSYSNLLSQLCHRYWDV